MEPAERQRLSRGELLAFLAPLALAVAAYARTLRGELQFDDLGGIAESGAVKALGPAVRGLVDPATLLAGRPLTTLTFAVNYAAGRLDPLGYHLVNLAVHLAASALAGLLALRAAGLAGAARPRRLALGVAGLFAVHPLQSQAVSYVSQRAEALASALYLATLLLLLARPPGARPRPWGHWAAALLTFALGLAAKPIVVTLPVAYLLVLLAAAPGEARAGPPAWRRALPAAGVATAAGLVLAAALVAALGDRPDAGLAVPGTSPWRYLLTQQRVLLTYLRLLVWPAGQSADWEVPTSPGLGDPATIAAAALVLALVAAGLALLLLRGRRVAGPAGAPARLAGLGLLWFFLVLAPTSSVIPLADPLAEHRAYLASWGVLLAAVAAADALAERLGRRRLATAAWCALVLLLAAALYQRNAVWETREALWRDVVDRFPGSARARAGLGQALDERGRPEEAIAQLRAALASPVTPSQRGRILLSLGVAQFAAGRRPEARRSWIEALSLLPDDDRILANLAMLDGADGEAASAESLARRALAVNPGQPIAWVVLGHLALERADWAAALSHYGRATALDPDVGDAHLGRALVLRALGRAGEECAALREALRAGLRPEYRGAAEADLAARCR